MSSHCYEVDGETKRARIASLKAVLTSNSRRRRLVRASCAGVLNGKPGARSSKRSLILYGKCAENFPVLFVKCCMLTKMGTVLLKFSN